MKTPLRLLIVEDSEDDVLLLVRQLKRGGYDVTFERIENAAAMNAALEQQPWDLVIDDYSVPGFNGLTALALFKEKGLDLPFIIVSGAIGEEIAVDMGHRVIFRRYLEELVQRGRTRNAGEVGGRRDEFTHKVSGRAKISCCR